MKIWSILAATAMTATVLAVIPSTASASAYVHAGCRQGTDYIRVDRTNTTAFYGDITAEAMQNWNNK